MKTGGIRRTGAICHPHCQAAQAGSLAHRYAEIKKGRLKEAQSVFRRRRIRI